ncbi:hypothetical protein [Halorientalis regularis]|uniref:Uncharacterized protein n=1 Tax=Halorientalis regularis TaxID=660518 RepID=A0A1G7IQW8_9EURY|nr:hypothetical protein [Halorientalis regularis]SDF15150.1 hypothetical protein SAMN05216218_10452 [Halorientalis regularis]
MDRPNLQGRVPETLTSRLPGGESDGPGDATGGSSVDDSAPDADESDSRRLTTVLTLSGLGLAALGVVLRYALDSRGESEADDEGDRDEPDLDRDFEGTVQVVGDTGAVDVADEAPSDATADENDAAEDERDGSTADAETEQETDVSVETFGVDRTADRNDGDGAETDDGDAEADREGPPRIAPLVGMVALVGMRQFVERVRKRTEEPPNDAAGQS